MFVSLKTPVRRKESDAQKVISKAIALVSDCSVDLVPSSLEDTSVPIRKIVGNGQFSVVGMNQSFLGERAVRDAESSAEAIKSAL